VTCQKISFKIKSIK